MQPKRINCWGLVISAIVVYVSLSVGACTGDVDATARPTDENGGGPTEPSGGPSGLAPVVGTTHLGWKSQDCASCHELPVVGHTATEPSTCAGCHGGNGACDPNGANVTQAHEVTDDCVGCHSNNHGFTKQSACASCHFAAQGRTDCSVAAGTSPSSLQANCFGWPAQDFSQKSIAKTVASLAVGSEAVDFTLEDVAGSPHSLDELLETKPVALVFGSYTCPKYQDAAPAISSLANRSTGAGGTYADLVHFVQVYTVEAHPAAPAPSPYRGAVWEAEYSSLDQAYSYAERVANAREVQPGVDASQLLLVDGLGDQSNPLWCTYGPCPNCAYLIGQDGVVAAKQTWVNETDLQRDIDALLGQQN